MEKDRSMSLSKEFEIRLNPFAQLPFDADCAPPSQACNIPARGCDSSECISSEVRQPVQTVWPEFANSPIPTGLPENQDLSAAFAETAPLPFPCCPAAPRCNPG